MFASIASRHLLEVSYIKADGRASVRVIEPIGCYNQSNKWYLVAYCRRQSDYRTFKMNRIQKIVNLDRTFDKRKLNLQTYLKEQAKAWTEKKNTVVVEVLFGQTIIEHVNRRKYYFGLIEEFHEPNGVRMTFWLSSLELMARWLLPFTNQATVIQPEALYNRIKELSNELYEHYHPTVIHNKKSSIEKTY